MSPFLPVFIPPSKQGLGQPSASRQPSPLSLIQRQSLDHPIDGPPLLHLGWIKFRSYLAAFRNYTLLGTIGSYFALRDRANFVPAKKIEAPATTSSGIPINGR
jgi:hypothetical protein